MGLKEEIKEKAISVGFDLVGVSDLAKVEELEALPERGLKPPSKIFSGAKSLLILGIVVWDEAMNLSISNRKTDGSNESAVYYNMYYEIVETRAWRLIKWLLDEKGVKGVPTHKIHLKPAATLAGLGFIGHNTQVVTEKYGPRVRFVGVFLDEMIAPDEPYSRDLCKEQKLCQENSRCVKACPYNAIISGPSKGVPFGKKVLIDKCVVFHLLDSNLEERWEKFSRRVTDRGFLECTLCNLVCPYGKTVDKE